MLACALGLLGAVAAAGPAQPVVAVVLGTAQDGGLPQVNCRCPRCAAARLDPRLRRRASSLALLDSAAGKAFLIDATPDLPGQLDDLIADPLLPLRPGRAPLDGILLTHAHVGHYLGLAFLGRETLGSHGVAVHASERMAAFLAGNAPWSQLVRLGQICLEPAAPGEPIALTPRLRATPLPVPHRQEYSDTVGWLIEGPTKRLLWLPDIDRWDDWERPIEEVVGEVDYAFLDATFASADEVPGRPLREIPHPLVGDTAARLAAGTAARRGRVFLVHFNHTNALLGQDPAAREVLAPARLEMAQEGLRLGL